MAHLGLKRRNYFRSKILQPLLADEILAQTMPDTPKNPNQQYYFMGPDETGESGENEDKQI